MFRLIFFIAVFTPVILHGQDSAKGRLNKYLSEMNISFKVPPNYLQLDSGFNFDCGDRQISSPVMYNLMKKGSRIKVAINFQHMVSIKDVKWIRGLYRPNFNPDSNYMYHARGDATGQNHKIVSLCKNYVKKHFNADDAVIYVRNCTIPIDKIYIHNKEIAIAKNGRGYVELTYIYTDTITEKEIDKEMLTTASMLRYNN